MAWTAPMTFVANTVLTAAQLNTHLRDNLLETAPAKATTQGGFFVATGGHAIAQRMFLNNVVSGDFATTSTSWVDGNPPGPTITMETGERAFLAFGCRGYSTDSLNDIGSMGIEVSGATSQAASTATAYRWSGALASPSRQSQASQSIVFADLTPGINTFTVKYQSSGGDCHFVNRRLMVLGM